MKNIVLNFIGILVITIIAFFVIAISFSDSEYFFTLLILAILQNCLILAILLKKR